MKARSSLNPSSSHEFWWVIGFCMFAAARVLFFCAAFPFFNNVDERRHFDLVIKYAEGHVPRGVELISPAARCAGSLCRDSNCRLAFLDENAFRRFHRRRLESGIAWMDNETVLGLVVASNLHRSGNVDVSFRTNCQLLARRIYVARPNYWLQRIGFILCPFLPRTDFDCRHFTSARPHNYQRNAPDALDRNGVCRRCNRVPWVVIAAVRLWRLHE